jgi:glycosyltransferase involved in cell wall biosynthesis
MVDAKGPQGVWYVFPYAGGPGIGRFTRPYDLAREWLGEGVSTTVFAAQHHHVLYDPAAALPAEFIRDEVRYRFAATRPYSGNGLARVRHMLGFTWALPALMRDEAARFGKPSAIIVSSPHPFPIWPAAAFAGRIGARLVFEVRDIWPLSLKETLGTPVWHPFYAALTLTERHAYRRADAVVSLLPAARDHMTARGLAPEKFNLIPNGAPDMGDGGTPVDAATAQWIGRCHGEGRRIVAYAGSFGAPNAMISFLEIADRLAAFPDRAGKLAFLFVGDGVERQPLQQGLGSRNTKTPPFLFTGQVTREAAAELLKLCDAGMILSRDTPLFRHGVAMNKLSEYMRLGKPIVAAYDASGDPITASGCGWRVPPQAPQPFVEVLGALADLPAEELAAMGARGRTHFLANYAYEAIAQKYLAVLGLA